MVLRKIKRFLIPTQDGPRITQINTENFLPDHQYDHCRSPTLLSNIRIRLLIHLICRMVCQPHRPYKSRLKIVTGHDVGGSADECFD